MSKSTQVSENGYYVQPMTGLFHKDPNCSCGTARYGTVPAIGTVNEIAELIVTDAVKTCKICA